jgi:phosphoesterase RecJ-like protein
VFDSNHVGRLKLFGAVLNSIELDPSGRLALIYVDRDMARRAGGTYDDTEGLINLPLTVKEIQAVAFFKEWDNGEYRISLRSKGEIDVAAVAKRFGGGGHKNAAGCTVPGPYATAREVITKLVLDAIEAPAAAH